MNISPDNKNIVIVASITVAVIIVVLLGWYLGKNSGSYIPAITTGSDNAPATGGGTSATRESVSNNVAVPTATSSVSADVAKPSVVVPAAPSSNSSFRSFAISVAGGEFSPSTVIVSAGDTVHINFTAQDKDYDFYQPDYGLSTALPKGVQKAIEFQATTPDKYTFYCKSCGGPAKGPVGYVVVVPKK